MHRKTLVGKVLRYTLILNSILICMLGMTLTIHSSKVFQEDAAETTEIALIQTNRVLSTTLIDIQSRLLHLSSLQSVQRCLIPDSCNYENLVNEMRDLDTQFAKIDLFNPVKDVFVLGNNGFIYNLKRRQNIDSKFDFTATEWYKAAIHAEGGILLHVLPLHDQLYYTEIRETIARKEQTFSLSMVVKHPITYETIGAIVCNFDLSELAEILDQCRTSATSQIALIDSNGVVCAQSGNQLIGETFPLPKESLNDIGTNESGHFITYIGNNRYLICYHATAFSDWKLISYTPFEEIIAHSEPLWRAMVFVLVVGLFINIVVASCYMHSISKRVNELIYSLAKVGRGDIADIPVQKEYYEFELISQNTNDLLERIRQLIRDGYQTQLELSRFELNALRTQINPHFLFNTLQLLQTEIVYGNMERSNQIIVSLSQLLRYYMSNNESLVPLTQEMEYLDKYLLLFSSKYEGRMKTSIEISNDAGKCMIPKLLIQPIVENSIVYVADQMVRQCEICITAYVDTESLFINCCDNGNGIDCSRLNEIRESLERRVNWMEDHIGLANVHQRIRTIYGEQYGLRIDSDQNGTRVTLQLPKELPSKG